MTKRRAKSAGKRSRKAARAHSASEDARERAGDTRPKGGSSARAKPGGGDPLDRFVDAAAQALALPLEAAWKPAVRANLEVTFRLASLFAEFPLPDDAEPAPVFKA